MCGDVCFGHSLSFLSKQEQGQSVNGRRAAVLVCSLTASLSAFSDELTACILFLRPRRTIG
jgi:hypothetical protein